MTTGTNRVVPVTIAVALVSTAAVAVGALTYSTPVANPALGDEWQCHKSLLTTSCTFVGHAPDVAKTSRQPICPPRS